jgi:peptide/nickel transport system substrate-binding protein/microcin C transport system substrate-binding protein
MKMKSMIIKVLLFAIFATNSMAALKPAGNANAVVGGDFKINLGEAPTTLNPLSSADAYASDVQAYIIESLLTRNPDTREWEPALAKEWTIAKDGMSFEFTLRDGVKWHDGKPLTVEDVKFSFDAIMEPTNKYHTADKKSYYENIKAVEILGPNKIKFIAGKPYFDNFSVIAGGLGIVPMHLYKDPSKEQEKILNKTLIGTGPYQLDSFDRAKSIILKKNTAWWGAKLPEKKGVYNVNTITMRFIKENAVAIPTLEKGDIDYIGLGAEDYMKKTTGPKWGKEVIKIKTQNKQARGYAFVGFNLQNPMFASKKTREAMVHLFNRKEMIKKFLFDLSLPATGPQYQQSEYADTSVKAYDYDPKLALKLLKEDGWSLAKGDKVLSKMIGGNKVNLSFTILEPDPEFVKYLTIFKEDAKQAGVDANVKNIEWNAFIKLLDERKFEAVRLSWSGGDLDWDPKQIWHSDSIANQGSNFVGYKNPTVDKLIEEARVTMDKKERIKKLKVVYKTIAEDVPYIFLFNGKFMYYAHTKRVAKPKDTFTYEIGSNYWWLTK